MAAIDFWYEFASTYSYPAAMRIEECAAARNVAVRWRPFLLGPIFGDQGWTTSPFNLYPAKGRYMWRDLERICLARGLAFRRPDPFPQNSLLAARVATALEGEERARFSRQVYRAQFVEGLSIDGPDRVAGILDACALPPAALSRAGSAEVKDALKESVAAARKLGIFGAPSFVTGDGELFWGDDRLEAALDWAVAHA
ncbi:MAG: 2-hydroxychromene-2-carboxylate isomerase [Hyphomicrobiales bacterium]|nr:2-hydroxychromene-2-carboxylate isomerase [Hyphomicrobiales bacterium]